MLQVPARLFLSWRVSVAPALLVALGASTFVFAATPLMLSPLADEYGVTVGAVGLMSTAQLGGFVLSSWFAGRFLRPLRKLFVIMCLLGVAGNLISVIAPNLAVLCASRAVSGVSLGLAAWFGWQAAFGDADKTGDVAVVGPLVGAAGSPIIAIVVDSFGVDAVFVMLAAMMAIPLLLVHQVDIGDGRRRRPTRRHTSTRAAQAILVALGMITLSGSAVFVYAASIGIERNGLSPFVVSLLYAGNALAGIPSARHKGRRGPAGLWFGLISVLAFLIAGVDSVIVFSFALIAWGLLFFMGLPAAFNLLASRSNYPEERAGDAQAIMAFGRVFGPLLGGAIVSHGELLTLGIVAGGIMFAGSILLSYVDRQRFVVNGTAALNYFRH